MRKRQPLFHTRNDELDPAGFAIVASGLQQCLNAGDELDSVDVRKMEKLFIWLA